MGGGEVTVWGVGKSGLERRAISKRDVYVGISGLELSRQGFFSFLFKDSRFASLLLVCAWRTLSFLWIPFAASAFPG